MNEPHELACLNPEQLAGLNREQLVERILQLQDQVSATREQMELARITDSLTGLANRDYFFASLTRLCMRAKRFGQMVCMSLVDIDNFRTVNERFGNLAGDLVLTTLGDLLRSVVRDYDLLARFGEDEFAVAIDNSDPRMVKQFAQRIRKAVAANPFCVDNRIIPITVTVGVVAAKADMLADRPDALVRTAIEAVDAAHRKGRDQWHFTEMTASAPIIIPSTPGS